MRKLTDFIFFKDTPFTDFQNTILFKSNKERDEFFLTGNHYPSLSFVDMPFNFIRDRGELHITGFSYDDFKGVNYCTFLSDFEPDTRFYAHVVNYTYVNDNVIKVDILVDGIMTYCQGDVINNFKNLKIERKHMSLSEYNERIDELKNNDDILKTTTKSYTHNYNHIFDDFVMIIQSSADFTTDFGTEKDPKIETSKGMRFDKITSPLNLYVVEQKHFTELMKKMSKFPWITQNIRSISLIPSILVKDRTQREGMESVKFDHLYTLKDDGQTNKTAFNMELLKISPKYNELLEMFDLDYEQERHLLRNEYTTTEVYTWDGQQLFIDNGKLNEVLGLLFQSVYVSGYYNEIGIFVSGYKGDNNNRDRKGSFLNDAIFFRNFDDVPILVDNYSLSLAKSANTRQLAESRLVTNRIGSIIDSGTDPKDRFYNAVSLATNFNPITLFGKFVDEHEYYQNKKAEYADLALETPTITGQSNNNSLSIAEDYFGIHVKHAQPNKNEWGTIKRYYKKFGFEVNDDGGTVDVFSNTMLNYVKFTGNFIIKNVDVSYMEMIKSRFENGMFLWHNNRTKNPMEQDVINNKMR